MRQTKTKLYLSKLFTPEGCDNRSPQRKLWVKIVVIKIKPQRGDTITVERFVVSPLQGFGFYHFP